MWVYRQYIGRPYIALARQVCQYIAIYWTHSAHFYELGINYGVCCSISHFAVHCNVLLNYFIICDCYITFTMCSYHFFQIHLATFIQLWNCIRAPPRRGRYWEIHPRRLRDFPRPEGRGKSRGRRAWISQFLPSFGGVRTFSSSSILSLGMDQEIHPSRQGRIDSVKIKILSAVYGYNTSFVLVEHGYNSLNSISLQLYTN